VHLWNRNPMFEPLFAVSEGWSMRRYTLPTLIIFALTAGITGAAEVADVVKAIEKSVVRVDTESSTGSGVIVYDQGYVITGYHLVEGSKTTTVVTRSGARLAGHGFLAVDPTNNLALIKTDPFPAGSEIKFADDLMAKPGTKAIALGCPRGFPLTTSQGTVSGVMKGADLRDALGPDSYKQFGCSPNTNWVQTTAAISTACTGGPLVNEKGELIGLNVWSHPQTPSLNYAIGLMDLARIMLLKKTPKNKDGHALASPLPPPNPTTHATPKNQLKLPLKTERVFSYQIFAVKAPEVRGMSDAALTYPSGALYAAAKHVNGKLHGPTAAQYESGAPMASVSFDQGVRHGTLKTWTETGEPILMAQYTKGKPDGFTAFHVGGRLAMLIQYRLANVELVQMMSGNFPLESYSSKDDALANPIARELFEKMDELDKKLKQNEFRFKNEVRELAEDKRKELAAKMAPQKRANQRARANARAAANNAALQELYRRANGG